MRLLEVRCCCQPTKLLGWLPVLEGVRAYRRTISKMSDVPMPKKAEFIHVHLPVQIIEIWGERYHALSSDETPIETLRMLPDFVEAK